MTQEQALNLWLTGAIDALDTAKKYIAHVKKAAFPFLAATGLKI